MNGVGHQSGRGPGCRLDGRYHQLACLEADIGPSTIIGGGVGVNNNSRVELSKLDTCATNKYSLHFTSTLNVSFSEEQRGHDNTLEILDARGVGFLMPIMRIQVTD